MGEIGKTLFQGPGAVLIQLAFLAFGTFIAEFIVSALGKGQYARLIVTAGLFTAFTLVLHTIGRALSEASKIMGF